MNDLPEKLYLEGKNKRNGAGPFWGLIISVYGIANHGLRYAHSGHLFVRQNKDSMERPSAKVLHAYDASLQQR
jgi:hypothetical protein